MMWDLQTDRYASDEEEITCAVTMHNNTFKKVWAERDASKVMTAHTADIMLQVLEQCDQPIITWNGLGFDFRVLSGVLKRGGMPNRAQDAISLALSDRHIDLMFVVVTVMGFPISLTKVAEAMLPPDTDNSVVVNVDAVELWRTNQHQLCVKHCVDNIALLSAIWQKIKTGEQQIQWITRTGWRSECKPLLVLDVKACTQLPVDHHMKNPLMSREHLYQWTSSSSSSST